MKRQVSEHFNPGRVIEIPKPKLHVLANSPIREHTVDHGEGRFSIVKTQDVEPMLRAIHELPDLAKRRQYAQGRRLLGSVPNVIALQWARESGLRLYSTEWMQYARKKLQSGEFAKLRVQY